MLDEKQLRNEMKAKINTINLLSTPSFFYVKFSNKQHTISLLVLISNFQSKYIIVNCSKKKEESMQDLKYN